jgi:hypothetical protein
MNKRIIGNFLKNMEISVMGKKMKLKLDEIKVESFVTALSENDQKEIKGGLEESSVSQFWTLASGSVWVCEC